MVQRAFAEDDVKIISATHINGKANFFAHPNSSPNTKTATKNISVGAMYCNIAMVESLSNFAPFAYTINGIAVTNPHPISNRVVVAFIDTK